MELKVSGNRVIIKGNVKSISDFNDIKNAVDGIIMTSKYVVIELIDSISLTSSVIGYLSKLVNVDGVTVELYVGDNGAYELLKDLGLENSFKLKRI